MVNFTKIVNESRVRTNFDSISLLSSEINKYMAKFKRVIPKDVMEVIELTKKYNILTSDELQQIMDASKSKLRDIVSQHTEVGASEEVFVDLQKRLKDLKSKIKMLPQFQSQAEREELEAGRLAMDDLTIDLETTAGKNAVAKMYTPMVYKWVNSYMGKSSLDKAALISAGMLGLANAIKDFDRSKTDQPFKAYASTRIRQAILDDMNNISHNLSGTNWYSNQNGSIQDADSLDAFATNDEGDYNDDRIKELGMMDLYSFDIKPDSEKMLAKLYSLLETKFSQRDCDIFYRFMGLKDYVGQKQKSKDIAKMYGMSEGNIQNTIIKKFIKFIKDTPKAMSIMRAMNECFEVAMMKELIYFDKQTIYEMLIEDNMFLLLEELSKYNNPNELKQSIQHVFENFRLEEVKYIGDCLEKGDKYINETYYINKNIINCFLNQMYPTENFSINENSAVGRMIFLSQISNDYKIVWND